MEDYKFGIDLGGTKIEGVVLGPDNAVVERRRFPTEAEGGYEHVVARIARMVDELEEASGRAARRVGVGTPGATDPPTGLLKNSNTVVLNGRPLARDLEEALDCAVRLANDANCFAVAEALMGAVPAAAPEARLVFGTIMGTGTGGGLVIDGRVWNGGQGIAGEWGHMFLDHSAGACYCGRVGCVERILAGPSVEAYYARRATDSPGLREIMERYRAGEALAGEVIGRWLHFFAKGIANVINVLDPDVVVLGGGLTNIPELHAAGVPLVEQFLFNPRMGTRFLRPALGDSAGVFGAALLQ